MKKSKKIDKFTKILAISNIIALIATIVINYLATSLPLGWMTTWELADLYPNLFVPVWLTFSIRWVIYLALISFVVRQIIDLFKNKWSQITKKIWIRFLLSCATNIGRIFAWHYKFILLSVLIIIFFLITVIVISKKIEIWKRIWSLWDKYFVQVPFSIYLGRISVATIANTTALLVNLGWSWRWMSEVFWTIIVICVAALLAILSILKNYNIIFAMVVLRAFLWIILKRLWTETVYGEIIWTLGILMLIISFFIWLRFNKWKKN